MTQPAPTLSPTVDARGRFRSTEPVPPVVTAAFWILVVGSALTAFILIATAIRIAGVNSDAAVPVLGVTLLGGAVGILVRIGIAVTIRNGYGPARIFLTVVSAYSIVVNALNGFDPIGLLVLASVVVPVILVWLPRANQYFRAVGVARRQAKAAGVSVGFLG